MMCGDGGSGDGGSGAVVVTMMNVAMARCDNSICFCSSEVFIEFSEQVVNFIKLKISNVIHPQNHLVSKLYRSTVTCLLCWYRFAHASLVHQKLLLAGEEAFSVKEVSIQAIIRRDTIQEHT